MEERPAPSLLTLPTEALQQIVELCVAQDSRYKSRRAKLADKRADPSLEVGLELVERWNWKDVTPSLLQFSRTCKAVRAICAPKIFASIDSKGASDPAFRRRILPRHSSHFRTITFDCPPQANRDRLIDFLIMSLSFDNVREVSLSWNFIVKILNPHWTTSPSNFNTWLGCSDEDASALRTLLRRARTLALDHFQCADPILRLGSMGWNVEHLILSKIPTNRPPEDISNAKFVSQVLMFPRLRHLTLDDSAISIFSTFASSPVPPLRSLTLLSYRYGEADFSHLISLFSNHLTSLTVLSRSPMAGHPLLKTHFPLLRTVRLVDCWKGLIESDATFLPSLSAIHLATERLHDEPESILLALRPKLANFQALETVSFTAMNDVDRTFVFTKAQVLDASFQHPQLGAEKTKYELFYTSEIRERTLEEQEVRPRYYFELIETSKEPVRNLLQFGLDFAKVAEITDDEQRMERLTDALRPLALLKDFEED